MATVNERIQDDLTARDLELERYKRGLILRVLKLLSAVETGLLELIVKLDPSAVAPRYRDARTARLLGEVQKMIDTYGKSLERDVLPELTTLAKHESQFGVRMFNGVIPVALDTVAPSVPNLKAAVTSRPFQGRVLKEWVKDHPPAVKARLRQTIRQGVAEGHTIDQMTRSIRGTAANQYRDGVMETNRRGAEAMVRTAVNHTVTAAREATYEANDDLIKGVRWVSTLDSRTSEVCMARDGKVYPINSGPRPPAHPNCRSSTVPIMKSWKELGIDLPETEASTRASMDGQVADATTYQTWLKGRDASFQDDVLGKTKGALFRRGDLPLDRFVDTSGRSYSIDELRRREPEAFKQAGLD